MYWYFHFVLFEVLISICRDTLEISEWFVSIKAYKWLSLEVQHNFIYMHVWLLLSSSSDAILLMSLG